MLGHFKEENNQNLTRYNYPGAKILKCMGFYADQEGIMSRYIHEQENWSNHLEQSRKAIINFIDKTEPREIAVLGSGWLLDIPIQYLSDKCRNIYLIDIRHPRQILHKYQEYKNIHFVLSDITGGAIEDIFHSLKSGKHVQEQLIHIKPKGFETDKSIDALISANILCQLDILIVEYIRTFKGALDNDIVFLRKKIQESHVQSLKGRPSCLITDYEEQVFDHTGRLITERPLLYTAIPQPEITNEWIWKFDTRMSYYPDRKTFFKVKTFYLV